MRDDFKFNRIFSGGLILIGIGLLVASLIFDYVTGGSDFGLRQRFAVIIGVVITLIGIAGLVFSIDWKGLPGRFDRIAVLLFFISLMVRLVFTVPVIMFRVQPLLDEAAYLGQATGYADIMRDLLLGNPINTEYADWAYKNGHWPPLNSLVLGVTFTLFGWGLTAPRLVITFFSALTTPLIFLLTKRLSTNRAGVVAASIHIVYYTFIAFSHYFWSETLYILLMLLSVFLATRISDDKPLSQQIPNTVFLGVALGLAGLTRATAIVLYVTLPIWMIIKIKDTATRILMPTLVSVVVLLILLPWEVTLYQREGHFVFLSTTGGEALQVGNNAQLSDNDETTCLGNSDCQKTLTLLAQDYAKEHEVTVPVARMMLAFNYMANQPLSVIANSLGKLQLLLTVDRFPFRHILRVIYPPLPIPVLIIFWFIALTMHLLFFMSVTISLSSPNPAFSKRRLFLAIIVLGLGLAAATTGNTRQSLPYIALLIPLAGHGITQLSEAKLQAKLLAGVVGLILLVFVGRTFPTILELHKPSGYYAPLVYRLNKILDTQVSVQDVILFRQSNSDACAQLAINTLNADYQLAEGSQPLIIFDPEISQESYIEYTSNTATSLLTIELSCIQTGQTVRLEPMTSSSWSSWVPSGIEGIDYWWGPKQLYTP